VQYWGSGMISYLEEMPLPVIQVVREHPKFNFSIGILVVVILDDQNLY
jgi:hypothetical protein